MAPGQENRRVDEEEAVEEGREGEPRVGPDEDGDRQQDGRDLEHPGEAVAGINAREREEPDARGEQDNRFAVR